MLSDVGRVGRVGSGLNRAAKILTYISSAIVEASGEVIAITGTWPASIPTSFALDPDGVPNVALTVSGAGFDRNASNQAVANGSRSRLGVGVEIIQQRVGNVGTGLTPNIQPPLAVFNGATGLLRYRPAMQPDEIDNGNGTRTIRIALDRYVAPGETVTLALRAGWRSGLTALPSVAVTNSSAVAHSIPSMRWACIPLERVITTSRRVDMLVSSTTPEAQSAVAAVRLVATDGTNIGTPAWATLSNSTLYGDSQRCWGADVSFAGLTTGMITVHATIYPWLGVPRHTSAAIDPAVTATQTPVANARDANAETGLVLGYDPTESRYGYTSSASGVANGLPANSTYYPYLAVEIDPVNGTTSITTLALAEQAVGVGATAAAARTSAAARTGTSKPRDFNTAHNALVRLGRTLAAANGSSSASAAMDAFEIVVPASTTTQITITAVTTTGKTVELPVTIRGGSRTTSVLQSPTAAAGNLTDKFRFENMTVECGQAVLPGSTFRALFGVNFRARTGFEAAVSSMWTAATVDKFATWAVDCDWGETKASLGVLGHSTAVARNITYKYTTGGAVVVANRRVSAGVVLSSDIAVPISLQNVTAGSAQTTLADRFIVNCYSVCGPGGVWGASLPFWNDGTRDQILRCSIINTVFEKVGAASGTPTKIGDQNVTPQTVTSLIYDGNTFVGDRNNHHYNDPIVSTLAEANAKQNVYSQCLVVASYFDRMATKDGYFDEPTVATARGLTGVLNAGRRNHMTGNLAESHGHGHLINADGWRFAAGTLAGAVPIGRGLGYLQNPNPNDVSTGTLTWPAFTVDACFFGTNAGFGDYRPAAGSPLLRATDTRQRRQTDYYRDGTIRNPAAWALGAEKPA